MKKELSCILGKIVADKAKPQLGAIGLIEQTPTGNTIMSVCALGDDDTWAEIKGGGRIALTPDERDELIDILISHRLPSAQTREHLVASSTGQEKGNGGKGAAPSRLTPAERREATELLARWDEVLDERRGSDAEHETGVSMAEFIWKLTGLPVR